MLILLDDKLTDLRWKCIKTRRNTNENYWSCWIKQKGC
jgi:hypothetical protein